ncbi:MAG: cyclase/dehydrase [Pseudonocardia sp.]|nr:cyclase/dehydrase [Pseudonocardia sp.]
MAETKGKPGLADALPTGALKDAGQRLLGLLVQRAAEAATDRVSDLSQRLTGVAENGGQGLRTALTGKERDEDEDEDARDGDGDSRPGLLKRGFTALKDKMKNAFGGGGGAGGKKKLKVTVISERQDIGLPLRTTYDLWTQFADFPTFMKKVESVEQASDEKTNWKAQIFLSHRTWEATIVEQVPDSHIVWRSKGPKGHVDGGVSFTGLGPNLTHVALILEYYPQGLFERTGNLWRAQGRRARLEFQHFRRHAMAHVLIHQEDVQGWRGEIHDSEVVKTHEEALEEEQRAQELEEAGAEDTAAEREGTEEEAASEEGTDRESAEEQPVEGEEEEGYEEVADEEPSDEDEEAYDEGDLEDEYEDEEPDEDSGDRVDEAREPVTASRSRQGR